jgi:hypothetical protein
MIIDISFSETDPDKELNSKYYELVIQEQMLQDQLTLIPSKKIITRFKIKKNIHAVDKEIRHFEWHKGVCGNFCIMDEDGVFQ